MQHKVLDLLKSSRSFCHFIVAMKSNCPPIYMYTEAKLYHQRDRHTENPIVASYDVFVHFGLSRYISNRYLNAAAVFVIVVLSLALFVHFHSSCYSAYSFLFHQPCYINYNINIHLSWLDGNLREKKLKKVLLFSKTEEGVCCLYSGCLVYDRISNLHIALRFFSANNSRHPL